MYTAYTECENRATMGDHSSSQRLTQDGVDVQGLWKSDPPKAEAFEEFSEYEIAHGVGEGLS